MRGYVILAIKAWRGLGARLAIKAWRGLGARLCNISDKSLERPGCEAM